MPLDLPHSPDDRAPEDESQASAEALAVAEAVDLPPLDPDLAAAVKLDMAAEGRLRALTACVTIPRPPEEVWAVLTDYEQLATFIPNLAKSCPLPDDQGRKLLEQIGTQNVLFLNFSARVVLEMQEEFPREIRFCMVEGDFQEFEGCWQLAATAEGTELTYCLRVKPKRLTPVIAIERRLKHDLPINLLAVRQQVCDRCAAP